MSKTHNAGIVTAYGAAVRGGYTGTYEEFCAQQAQYAENARQMEQAVSDVRQIKTSVESAVSEAEGYANNANQSATNASNSATQASESASNANQSANNASSSADSASQSASSAQTSANNASTSEQNAHQSAEDAHQSVEDAQDILESVQTEGNTQIGRVQAKGNEIIDSLPDDFTEIQNELNALNGSLGTLKADLAPLGLVRKTYTYTASSGYQSIPISLEQGIYIATYQNGGASATFRDANNQQISGLSIPVGANDHQITISAENADAIAFIRMYQGVITIAPKDNILNNVNNLEWNLGQDREARYNLDKKNTFAWKAFDKAYFSFMNDDGRADMYQYKNLCDTYNIPYANAMPWENIKNNTITVDGMSIVDYAKKIVNEGGEIFVHTNSYLTSASTEEDIVRLFADGKKIIEDAIDAKVYGIIEAGGSGYSTFDYETGQKFCLAYYEFSDGYGLTPQYKLVRTRILRSNYNSDAEQIAAFKAVIDDAITNKKWVRFYCHSTDEVSISVLTSVFDYIATKVDAGDCAWTTWKGMYDTFRSSSLENAIDQVENYLDSKDIDGLETDVEKVSSYFVDLDLISGFINGVFSGSNLTISYNAPYLAIYFPVLSGRKYTIDKKMVTPYFRTGFSQSVPEIGTVLDNYISAPVGAEYAQITAPYSGYCAVVIAANASDHDYLRNNAVVYEGTYIQSVTKKSANLVDINNIGNRVFYCGATRDITTLKGGIEEATKYMDSTLCVDSGTYDLVQEFGQEWFDSLTSGATLSGLVLKNNIHVVFSPNSKVVSHYAGSNQYAQSLYSPFNAGEYGYTIENLNLECSRCRYAIHDERNGEDELYRAKMINCKMSIDNSQNDYWSNHHCVGGGLGTNAEVTIKNCVFSTDVDTNRWGVYYHIQNSRTKTNYRTILVIEDNYFITGAISLDDVTATPASVSDDSEFIITNNSFPTKYAGTNDEGIYVGLTKSYALRAWNNKIRQTS